MNEERTPGALGSNDQLGLVARLRAAANAEGAEWDTTDSALMREASKEIERVGRENANLRIALAEQGIDEPLAVDMAANSVDIPQSADHAELMLKMGWMWLTMHAPERLKKKA